jgi:hypothetical protein
MRYVLLALGLMLAAALLIALGPRPEVLQYLTAAPW